MPDRFGRGSEIWDALRARTLSLPHDGGGNIAGADGENLGLGNKIIHYDAGGNDLTLYDATQAGLISALAVADAGDTVWLPSRQIDLTVGITLQQGIALIGLSEKSTLSFSGFSGVAITMALAAVCHGFTALMVSNGTTAIGVDARFADAIVSHLVVEVSGGSSINIAVWAGVS